MGSSPANGRAASRRVAEMDMAKLYRKRAIDRDNQRNLRHKNKHRIQQLEGELAEIIQQLEASRRESSRLAGEAVATRSTVGSIIKSLQALESGVPPRHNGEEAPDPSPQTSSPSTAPAVEGVFFGDGLDTEIWSEGGFVSFAESDFSGLCLPDFSFDMSHLLANFQADPASPRETSMHPAPPRVSDDVFHSGRKLANTLRADCQLWKQLPRYCSPTCRGDEWMTNLIQSRTDARDAAEFAHRDFPSINSLVNPSIAEPDMPVASTVAKNLTDITRVYTLPEKIALLYVISHLLRWQIMPSEETYALMPEFSRPTLAQIMVQHPCWVGTIGWPKARERIISHMDYTQYPQFATIITRTFSINWPHGLNGIIEGHANEGYKLREAFMSHVDNIDNWSVGQELVDMFPFLEGAVNVK